MVVFQLDKALLLIRHLLIKANKLALISSRKFYIKKYKDVVDISTNVDYQIQKLIVSEVKKTYPDHNIYSEEDIAISHNSDYSWYIDPLDGTKEFVRQIPSYCLALCLLYRQQPILSGVSVPYYNQIFLASLNQGAFLNNQPIFVNKQNDLRKSYLVIRSPVYGKLNNHLYLKSYKIIDRLTKAVYRVRYACNDNIYLAYLAMGSIDTFINFTYPTKSIQDYLPGLFIAQMAGAQISDLQGQLITQFYKKQLYLASNSQLHSKILNLIT